MNRRQKYLRWKEEKKTAMKRRTKQWWKEQQLVVQEKVMKRGKTSGEKRTKTGGEKKNKHQWWKRRKTSGEKEKNLLAKRGRRKPYWQRGRKNLLTMRGKTTTYWKREREKEKNNILKGWEREKKQLTEIEREKKRTNLLKEREKKKLPKERRREKHLLKERMQQGECHKCDVHTCNSGYFLMMWLGPKTSRCGMSVLRTAVKWATVLLLYTSSTSTPPRVARLCQVREASPASLRKIYKI